MKRWLTAGIFTACILLANILTSRYGFVPVGFGLMATAGTYAAGAALVARDYTQQTFGVPATIGLIAIGCILSWLLAAPAIAFASAVAFIVSELGDMCVYTPMQRRHWRAAVIGSSIVGAIVDTVLFVGLAFGPATLTPSVLAGQLVAKVLWVAVPIALVGGLRRRSVELSTT